MKRESMEEFCKREEKELDYEYELIRKLVETRESKKLSQAALANIINFKQPVIAKIELMKNSPQINTLLKILVPMGYKLDIVPIKKSK